MAQWLVHSLRERKVLGSNPARGGFVSGIFFRLSDPWLTWSHSPIADGRLKRRCLLKKTVSPEAN